MTNADCNIKDARTKLKNKLEKVNMDWLLANDVSKKKYYDFIQNLPLFIPMKPIGKKHFLQVIMQQK